MAVDGASSRPSDSSSSTPTPKVVPDNQRSADLGNSREGGDAPKEIQSGPKLTPRQKLEVAVATLAFVINSAGLSPIHTASPDRGSRGDQHQIVTPAASAPREKSSPADSGGSGAQVRAAAPASLAAEAGAGSGASPDADDKGNEPGEGLERNVQYGEQKKKEEEMEEAGDRARDSAAAEHEPPSGAERRSAEPSPAFSTQTSADLFSSRVPAADSAGRS